MAGFELNFITRNLSAGERLGDDDQKVYEKTTPANIASPPRVGTLDLCAFLSPGSSKRFFMMATLIIEGIARKVMINAVIQPKAILIMKGNL